MKSLKDFKDDINKCSKCGLCQSVCPIYKITGNDCTVSRGKFAMLEGVLKGNLILNKNIDKYLDMCNKCGKCKDFCPSGIDAVKIFETAKYEYAQTNLFSKLIFFIESKLIFNNILNFFSLFNSEKSVHASEKQIKLLYFKGCANKILPKNEFALKKILKNYNNVEIIEKDFGCCGVPFLSSGNLKRYEEVKEKNSQLMKGIYDYIITDCASCEDAIKQYEAEIPVINIMDFLVKYKKKFIFNKPLKVTFHKPCHLKNTDFLKPILELCENVKYVEMKDFDECCGFSGEFAIKNPGLAYKIMQNKTKNVLDTDADIVLTLCPACIIGLRTGLTGKKNAPKVMNFVEFLSKADNIN